MVVDVTHNEINYLSEIIGKLIDTPPQNGTHDSAEIS